MPPLRGSRGWFLPLVGSAQLRLAPHTRVGNPRSLRGRAQGAGEGSGVSSRGFGGLSRLGGDPLRCRPGAGWQRFLVGPIFPPQTRPRSGCPRRDAASSWDFTQGSGKEKGISLVNGAGKQVTDSSPELPDAAEALDSGFFLLYTRREKYFLSSWGRGCPEPGTLRRRGWRPASRSHHPLNSSHPRLLAIRRQPRVIAPSYPNEIPSSPPCIASG